MKNTQEILELFRKNILLECTIRKLAQTLKKPYPKIHQAVKDLHQNQILKLKDVGNAKLCSFNFSPEGINEMSYLETKKALSRKIKNMELILSFEELFEEIIIVTGSYAKNLETKKSDIDLIIITNDDALKKQRLIENLTLTMKPEFHIIVFHKEDFIKMLLSKQENLGKEIFGNKLIFRGAERYYLTIAEAIKNGFLSKTLFGKSW